MSHYRQIKIIYVKNIAFASIYIHSNLYIMHSTINQRIKHIADIYFNGSVSAMARTIFVKQPTLRDIVGERNSEPGAELIAKIVENATIDVNPEWLLTGKGEMHTGHNNRNFATPYYDVDFIGGFDLVGTDQTLNPAYYIDFKPYNVPGVLWCNVLGRSMEPDICNGDIIALKETTTSIEYLPYGEVYALVTNDFRTVKRVTKSDLKGFIRLVPINQAPEYATQDIPIEIILKVFIVLGSFKRF